MSKPQDFDFDECMRKLRHPYPEIYEDGFGMITDYYGGENRVPQYTDRLIELLRNEQDEAFRGTLIELLGYSRDPKVIPILLAEFESFRNQAKVVGALRELGTPETAALADRLDKRIEEELIPRLNREIEAHPNNAELYQDRAGAYFSRKEYDKSLDDVRRAEALGPTPWPWYRALVRDLKKELKSDKIGSAPGIPQETEKRAVVPSPVLVSQRQAISATDGQPQRFGPSFFSRVGLVSLALDALPFVAAYLGYTRVGLIILAVLLLLYPFVLLNVCWVTVDGKKIIVSRLGRRQMVLLNTIKKVVLKSEYEWGVGGSFWPRQCITLDSEFKKVEIDTTAWEADVEEELLTFLSEAGLDFGFRLKNRGLRDSFSSDPDV